MKTTEDESGEGTEHQIPFLFTELLELTEYKDGAKEWKELFRWVKYEETVEEAGHRWSKPHISTPTLYGTVNLRRFLKSGIVLLELQANNLLTICSAITEILLTQGDITRENAGRLKDLILLKHRHQFEGPRKVETGLGSVIKDLLVQKLEQRQKGNSSGSPHYSRRGSVRQEELQQQTSLLGERSLASRNLEIPRKSEDLLDGKVNVALMKKLPEDAEAAVVLCGTVAFLEKPISVFIRLEKPVVLGDLPEVDIPTRFVHILVGPAKVGDMEPNYTNVGRAMGSAFADKDFNIAIVEADSREDIILALDTYLEAVKTLPANWNVSNYIEPPKGEDEKEKELQEDETNLIDDDRRNREASGLLRTSRPFGGLINDIKRKAPHYLSDFRDGLHTQCISSFLFLYFACLAPIVAFGALLGEATEQRIATIEGLVAGMLSGVLFSLFSGQPLNLLGSTGPVYVFEKILYSMCIDQNWDYLSLRLWIGIWVGVMLILLVAFDASAYVCYITRFTEELFATLVAFIFIMSAFQNTFSIKNDVKNYPCHCLAPGVDFESEEVLQLYAANDPVSAYVNGTHRPTWYEPDLWNLSITECLREGGEPVGAGCDHGYDVFLMSLVLFFGSFTISIALKQFRTTGYFPSWVRNFLSDFAVIIGILTMTAIDYFSALPTPKLNVPSEFKPTWEERSWVVTHALIFPDHLMANPWWVDMFLAPVFACLATILIFMDQQITAVIVNRKEYKLKKGCGYHLDLLVLALIIVISSVFGLPWFIANTIPSINHMQSLTKESTTSIPGEKPQFLGIREQRVTSLLIAILTGLSVLMTPVLALLPMPVLYGVFLFMGVSSLRGLQLFDRILLLFMPTKNQPNFVYLKYVPLGRVHLFTIIQLCSLALLWAIKSYPATSIAFPVMLVVLCFIRKMIECIFSNQELRALDDLLPGSGQGPNRKIGIKADLEENVSQDDVDQSNANSNKKQAMSELLDEELEELVKNHVRNRLMSKTGLLKLTKTPPTKSPPKSRRILIYVKMEEDDIYTPLYLTPLTTDNLIKNLKSKFEQLNFMQITGLMQKNKRGITFPLDNHLMEFMENQDVFIIRKMEGENAGVLTLIEQRLD